MLLSAQIAIVVVVLAYFVLLLRSKLRRKPVPTEDGEKEEEPKIPVPPPAPLAIFPFAIPDKIVIPGSELRYLHPFGALDSIENVWCKLQTLTSPEPIVVRFGTVNSAPLMKSGFTPDGVVHSTDEMFAEQFAASILKCGWSTISRQVRALSSFGVPPECTEGRYHIFTGGVIVELKGVPISGAPFQIQAVFALNLRLIRRHFVSEVRYLHCPVPKGETEGGMEVGFPWSLSHLMLYCEDRCLQSGEPEFVQKMKADHAGLVQPDSRPGDLLISDGVVAIHISEGVAPIHGQKTLQVVYAPAPGGPLDQFTSAEQDFVDFAGGIRGREVAGFAAG